MGSPVLVLAFLSCLLSILTISSSIKTASAKKRILELEEDQENQQLAYEVLQEIRDSLDASLSIQTVVTKISKHIKTRLPYSTLSTLIINDEKPLLSFFVREHISHAYIADVKERMLESLTILGRKSFANTSISEEIMGTVSDTTSVSHPQSVYHLPLILHDSVIAIITVTAIQPHRFHKKDILTFQHITKQASQMMSKLDSLLQEQKAQLNAVTESLTDGLLMIDPHNTLQFINPTAKQLLALPQKNVTTMDVLSALPIHVDFQSKLEAALNDNQASEIANVVLHARLVRFRITPIRGAHGKPSGATILMRDETITNSVPRMKEDFTNILVHELRNPLTSIKASSELLISPVKFSSEEQNRLMHVIYQQSNKLLKDVQQILDAAKLEAGVFTIHKKTANIKELIHEVTEQFQKEAQEKLIHYIIDVDFNLPAFSFDEKYLGQALTNLLSNSMKFTSQCGTVHVSAQQINGNAVITIADTGAGIAKEKQHKLFHKFSQLEEASATVGKGLGLYVAKGIVNAHEGKITMESDRGRGTTITLTLPLHDPTHVATNLKQPEEHHHMVN